MVCMDCTVPKHARTTLRVVLLYHYQLNPDFSLPDEINYSFISSANKFYERFFMTKSTPGAAMVPNFDKESVVSIVLKPSEKVRTIVINKATVADGSLNVYFTITDTSHFKTYAQRAMVVATLPKSRVRRVNFFQGNVKANTIFPEN